MGNRHPVPNPTPAELEILRVLWRYPGSTVRELHERLDTGRNTGYTTVLKLLQIMTEKKLVMRDEAGRAHVYRPGVPEEQVKSRMVDDLVERAFGGAAQGLVMHALSTRKASAEELAEIRRLLDQLEGEEK
jgi:predicted transcriptional regulator